MAASDASMLALETAIEDRMMQAMKIKYHQHATVEELVEYGKEPESDVCGREGFNASLTIACAPTSSYEEVEAFYMDLEKFHGAEHTFYKVIIGALNARIDPRRTPEELHFGTHTL